MSIMAYAKKALGNSKKVERLDIDKISGETKMILSNIKEEYSDTDRFLKINGNRADVDRLAKALREQENTYNEKIRRLKEDGSEKEKRTYTTWEKVYKGKILCKWMAILMFVVVVLNCVLSWSGLIPDICFIIFAVGLVLAAVLKVIEMVFAKKYDSYADGISRKAWEISNSYRYSARSIWQEADELFIATLDQGAYQTLLLRREKRKQHEQMLEQERRKEEEQRLWHAAQMMEQRKQSQEQKKIARATERMLEIEEERERRRR